MLSASRVATVLAMMPGFAKRDGRDQRAQPEIGVKTGEHAESDPRLGDRFPGAVYLGNLDQMVHQGDAVEADGISCERQVPQPAAGIRIPPGKPRDLEHDSLAPLGP